MTATVVELPLKAIAEAGRRHPLRRLLKRPVAVASLVVLLGFVTAAVFAPLLMTHDPDTPDYTALLASPSGAHLLGTDDLGRDVYSRLLAGARVSLLVGVATAALAFAVAVPIGLAAGYYRGWLDTVVARSVDVLLAFPYLIIAVGMAVILGPSLSTVVLALALGQLPWILRITRGEVLALREREYVAGAILDGARDRTILFRYLLPNLVSPLLVQLTLLIPFGIVGEALLSFLGLGVRPPTATWGVLLSNAQSFVQQAPLLAVFPGAAIALITFAFNLLGDALRDILDPRSAE